MAHETETIYARVKSDVKSALDAYAEQNGKSITGAVAELLQLGMAAAAAPAAEPMFSSMDEWCEEMYALLRIESVAKMMVDLGNSIISGRTSDVAYYRRARVMLAKATAEWALALPRPLEGQESDNG